MELILIEPESPEWNYMWEWLANHPINSGLEEPSIAINENEGWQYMGSFKQANKIIHEFRHRNHPATNAVQSLKVRASENITEDQIVKNFKL